ncbi:MAG: hypothetical protein JWN84_1647 [Nocardioides sp.]|nr:hypothetical protein [Nocardioides sp.]
MAGANVFAADGNTVRSVTAEDGSANAEVTAASGPLTAREVAVLEFAALTWRWAGAQESAIRARFDWPASRYFQVLNALIGRPEALAHDPMLVNRLRRLRASRAAQRSSRDMRDTSV